jgi:hypothetical protein
MCDTLVALAGATVGGATLFAKNSDRPPDEAHEVRWVPSRRDRRPVRATHLTVPASASPTLGAWLSKPAWCWGAEHGVNEAGVAIGNEAIYTTLDPRLAPPALTGLDLVRLGLERGHTAAAAVDVMVGLLEAHGQGGTGHDPRGRAGPKAYWSSFLVADPHEAYVLETSGRHWAVERVGGPAGVRAISNRTTIASFDAAHRHPRQPVEELVDPRWQASQRLLATAAVDVESLVRHLRSHDSCATAGWSVCMHGRDQDGHLVEVTTASMVAELRADGGPHRVWWVVGSPCRTEYRLSSVPPGR